MAGISHEESYCWMERGLDDGGRPGLLLPFLGSGEPLDLSFGSTEDAVAYLRDLADQGLFDGRGEELARWVLCRQVLTVLAPAMEAAHLSVIE